MYRYYHGVASFNNEAALRERLLQKLFNVTGPATTGIFKNVKGSDKRLETWLDEVPSRLADVMRDLQYVLGELRHMPGVTVSGDDAKRLAAINRRETEAYNRWKAKHRDHLAPAELSGWEWSSQDESAD